MSHDRALELLRICNTDTAEQKRQAAWDEFWHKLPHPRHSASSAVRPDGVPHEPAQTYYRAEVERARWRYLDRISDVAMIEMALDAVLPRALKRLAPGYTGRSEPFEVRSLGQFLSFVRKSLDGELKTRRRQQPVNLESLAGEDSSPASLLAAPEECPAQADPPAGAATLLRHLVESFEAYLAKANRPVPLRHFRLLRTAVAVVTGEDSESAAGTLDAVFELLRSPEGAHWHWPEMNDLMRELTGQDPSQNNKRLRTLYREFRDSPAAASALQQARDAARLVEEQGRSDADIAFAASRSAAGSAGHALSPVKDWVRWSRVDALFGEIYAFLAENEPPDRNVLFLKHTPRQQIFVRALLGLVKSRLTREGLRVATYENPLRLALACEVAGDAQPNPAASDVLLLPDIDRFPELPLFRNELLAGQRVLATATEGAWRKDYPWECVLERDITAVDALPQPLPIATRANYLECVRANGPLGLLVEWTAAFLTWNWPLPVSLAARLLGVDSDRLLQLAEDSQGLLYVTELDGATASSGIVAESPWMAREVFAAQLEESGCERAREQMAAALRACESSGERLVVGSALLRMLTVGAYKHPDLGGVRGVREILRRFCGQSDFPAIVRQALASEIQLWARVWAGLHEYPSALAVLDAALARGGPRSNPAALAALRRERAGLLARWSEADDASYAVARQAFQEAGAGGPELELQQATMELNLGHYPEALGHLRHALQWLDSAWGRERPERTAGLRRSVLVTQANCHLEWSHGSQGAALKWLDEAQGSGLSHVAHVRAKAEYYAGRFDAALQRLEPLLALPSTALAARNLQGMIGLHRGHLGRAREAFASNLAVLPESLPDLMGAAELHAARGDLARTLQRPDAARIEYELAERRLQEIRDIQPVNPRAAVALGTLYARRANLDPEFISKAENVLHDVVRAKPATSPRAWHALAQLNLRHRDWEEYARWKREPRVKDALRPTQGAHVVWLLHDLEIGLRHRAANVIRDRCLDVGRELRRAAEAYLPDGISDNKLPVHEIIHAYNAAARLLLDHHRLAGMDGVELLTQAAGFVAEAQTLDPPEMHAYTLALQADVRAAPMGAEDAEVVRLRGRAEELGLRF